MSRRFYPTSRRTEPNMRDEFNNTMDGLYPEIPKAQGTILRKMRRQLTDPIITDSTDPNYDATIIRKFHSKDQIPDYYVPEEGYLIHCVCISSTTSEPDLDSFCPICHGERYIWDETFIDTYKVSLTDSSGASLNQELIKPGLTNIPLVVFYTRSSVPITKADKIVQIWTDEEGQPRRPYRRRQIFRIGTAIEFRSDNGKLEYWKLDCHEEQRKYLNGPRGG